MLMTAFSVTESAYRRSRSPLTSVRFIREWFRRAKVSLFEDMFMFVGQSL